jgi:endogenous inhibitor of DNA gyrase (YacG/DUF329 family)
MNASEAARVLAAQETARKCPECGAEFRGRGRRRYCTRRCKFRAERRRIKERRALG